MQKRYEQDINETILLFRPFTTAYKITIIGKAFFITELSCQLHWQH